LIANPGTGPILPPILPPILYPNFVYDNNKIAKIGCLSLLPPQPHTAAYFIKISYHTQ